MTTMFLPRAAHLIVLVAITSIGGKFLCEGFLFQETKLSHSFEIHTEWDSTPISKDDYVKVKLEGIGKWLRIEVEARFYNDPPPPNGTKGKPYPGLYNYEVVEAFFLNDKDQYLEVELAPGGEHLLLMLNGMRNDVVQQLPVYNMVQNNGSVWKGTAYIDNGYFPFNITKFNAYAIHGTGKARKYLSLNPAPKGKYTEPDFHRLELFKPINLNYLPPFGPYILRSPALWYLFPPRK